MPKIRYATDKDITAITELIALSAQQLGGGFYNQKTIKSALKSAFGVDSQLIKDQNYYVIEQNNKLIACGGWSYRKTLFGSDYNNLRNPEKLNPKKDAAKIRAFFIHPHYARQGLGSKIIEKCEQQATKKGFKSIELMGTLSGINFYKKHGYRGKQTIFHKMNDGNIIEFLPMQKKISTLD